MSVKHGMYFRILNFPGIDWVRYLFMVWAAASGSNFPFAFSQRTEAFFVVLKNPSSIHVAHLNFAPGVPILKVG